MIRKLLILFLLLTPVALFAQWETVYVTLDNEESGTGDRTAGVAVVGPNRFVALIAQKPGSSTEDTFEVTDNYLVGYWDADSVNGRVDQPAEYGGSGKFIDWVSGLDLVTLRGGYQIAGGKDNLVYLANNDVNHNILVFELTASGVVSTDFRMETGTENIWAIEVDTAGYVYVVDFKGSNAKDNEVKIFAPIGAPNTNWDTAFLHTDAPVTTIDLPEGEYHGVTVNGDGSMLFVSSATDKKLLKFTGSPESGYTVDSGFEYSISLDDSIRTQELTLGAPSIHGLAYDDASNTVFAVVDTFFYGGELGGYSYGRIYLIDALTAVAEDTIDIAAWNFSKNGSFTDASGKGHSGGFTTVMDVEFEPSELAIYTQTYFGWAVEKWHLIGGVVSVEGAGDNTPATFSLNQNYPNPFNPTTTIEFSLDNEEFTTLEVYNLIGQKVGTLVNERLNAGSHQVSFSAQNIQSGVYFYVLKAGQLKEVKKMVFTK